MLHAVSRGDFMGPFNTGVPLWARTDGQAMFETILVGLDESDAAQRALAEAVDLASQHASTVHVLTVVEPPRSTLSFGVSEIDAINRAKDEVQHEHLERYADRPIELIGVVRRGHPTERILAYASEIGADLIVIGQRGEDGLEQLLLGSTADGLARLTEVPLWIVPSRKDGERQSTTEAQE